jgi:hypothetical protein
MPPPPPAFARLPLRTALLVSLGIIVLAALVLLWMGRIPICKCGYVKLWHGGRADSEVSQHLADWYTYTHVLHGVIFYFALWAIFRDRLSVAARLLLAVGVEAGWEIFENTSFVINRYRTVTISRDYFGDSVINSVGDMLAMTAGFLLAARLPVWATVALLIAIEVWLAFWIRDNLTLNILMLIHPVEAIKHWQTGA